MTWLLLAVFCLAHAICCIVLINRLHATALPYWFLKLIDWLWYVALFGGPVLVGLGWLLDPTSSRVQQQIVAWKLPIYSLDVLNTAGSLYAIFAGIVGMVGAGAWWVGRWIHDGEKLIVAERVQSHPLSETVQGRSARDWVSRLAEAIPGNQVYNLQVHEKTLELASLPPELDGLTIGHLSDLHFTGRTGIGYYRSVVELANQFEADYLAIAGDIIDKRRCFSWLVDVLGDLRARHGKFFVLGNHDLRVHDEPRVRRMLESTGFQDLGGRVVPTTYRGKTIVWAGNELPWFSPAADLRQASQEARYQDAFRIVVSHSPDQIAWARAHAAHLMLAGHTHGGQIRLPFFGAIFSPSLYGVRYASGTFFVAPTALHVSRGLSGTRPIRIGCPPELTKLTLRCAARN